MQIFAKTVNIVQKILQKHPNLVITLEGCPFCENAVNLLRENGIRFEEMPVESNREDVNEFQKAYRYKKFPMIFLEKEFVGGFTDLKKLFESENRMNSSL